ncbi:MAG TPA: DNA polymerase III subunit gamma/tau [Steroidobacteraceae bacterium]|nr:DNA polymerase III subunit gamma/tau [Steroidobacteraceae bacterium]
MARKWRPRRFADMIGQEHVRRALTHALDTDRVHHAFLFTGTRGVGKTTIARILAKCLNCDRGVSASPCDECPSCVAINEGRFVDLIEVDAASRTKVDDTRELLDNVQYAPTQGRYKVYLIDEVHMLSTHSFNALLKTLEEPPPRVKFLLATTDPQKLPATVLSRCLQFNLKRLPVSLIAARLQQVLELEGIGFESAGLRLLAQAADGSMRDALSLLDQVIAFGGGSVAEAQVRDMLGTVARDHVVKLAQLMIEAQAARIVAWVHELEQWAPDHAQLLDEFAALLVRVALVQAVPDYDGDELYELPLLLQLAQGLRPEDVQLYYQTAIIGRRDLHLAPDPRAGFEMTLLRMLGFRYAGSGPAAAAPPATGASRAEVPPAGSASAPAAAATAPPAATSAGDWTAMVADMGLSGAVRSLALNCQFVGQREGVIRLALDARYQASRTPGIEAKLQQALNAYFATSVRLEFVAEAAAETPAQIQERERRTALVAARQAFGEDPTVKALQERFGATLLPDTIRPTRSDN